jgi:hypothetical protein
MNLNGVKLLRFVLIIGCMLAFAAAYVYAAWQVWTASGDTSADLNKGILYVGAALGSVLGTYFAVALGVQSETSGPDKIGEALTNAEGPPALLATGALWIYAAVGIGVGVTVVINPGESPQELQALAAVFGGYVLAVFGAVFTPGSS